MRLHGDSTATSRRMKKKKIYMIHSRVGINFAKCMANPFRIDGDFIATPRRLAEIKKYPIRSGVAIKFSVRAALWINHTQLGYPDLN